MKDEKSAGNFSGFLVSLIRKQACRATLAAAVMLMACGDAGAALNVSPGSVTNSFNGVVTLTVTGLDNSGQTVIVEKFFDADASGGITAGDMLIQRFSVTDGQVTSLGGRRNLNVPGDEDTSANGTITTKLYLAKGEIAGRLAGRHIFRVSPAGSGFSPFTGDLIVTQQDHGGSGLNGTVKVGVVPQAGSIVLITSGASNDFDLVGIARTDGSGNFSLKLPPGLYRPVATMDGHFFDFGTSAASTVGAGAFTTTPDVMLTPAARTISGTVREDTAPNTGLPAVFVFADSGSGKFSLTLTDVSGNYVMPMAAEECQLGVAEQSLAILGMLQREGFNAAGAGNLTGFHLDLPRATSLIHGRLRTDTGTPLPFIQVIAELNGVDEWRSDAITDADGYFTLGTTTGSWRVEVETPGYLVAFAEATVNSAGTAVEQDLTAYPITSHLRGQASDNLGNPLAFVEIIAHDFQGITSWGFTDAAGNFDLGVFGGPGGTTKQWSIQLNQGGDGAENYVSTSSSFDVVDGTDINGINYLAYLVTAHLRGHVLDENNVPVGGFNVFASGPGQSGSTVQGDGSFDIPVFGGSWQIGLSDWGSSSWIPQSNLQVTVTDGVDVNGLVFRVRHTSGNFVGSVKNAGGTGLGGIEINANVTVGGVFYSTSTETDGSGNYTLPVFAETWSIGPDSADLQNLGYQPVNSQNVFINSGNVTVNFVVAASGGQTFSSWRNTKFTAQELADPALCGPAADFEKDGISNLMEYALNLEPKIPDVGGLPAAGRQAGWLTLTFTRLTGSSGLTYTVVQSGDLGNTWNPVTEPYEVLSNNGATETVQAKAAIIPGGRAFLRLKVVDGGP